MNPNTVTTIVNNQLALLPPCAASISEIRESVQEYLLESEYRSQFADTAKLAAIGGGAIGAIAAIGTGGLFALACGTVSVVGALSSVFYSAEECKVVETEIEKSIKYLAILDGIDHAKLAKLWKLSGDSFGTFLRSCTNAVRECSDGWAIMAVVGGEPIALAISQGVPRRYCSTYEIEPEMLKRMMLGSAEATEVAAIAAPETTVKEVTPENAAMTAIELPAVESDEATEVDLVQKLTEVMFSYLLIGATGSGKGYLTSHGWRSARAKGLYVFVCDPKNDPKERGYWEGVDGYYAGFSWDKSKQFRFMSPELKDEWLIGFADWYEKMVERIKGAPHLLVFDEWTAVIGHLNTNASLKARIVNLVCDTASQGDSSRHYVWLMGHTCNLADLGISGGRAASFKKVYIYSHLKTDRNTLVQALNTTYFGQTFKAETVENTAKLSACDRAFFHGADCQWYPMAALQNFSGYDRDTDTYLEVSPVEEPPIEVEAEEVPTVVDSSVVSNGAEIDLSLNAALNRQIAERGIKLADTEVVEKEESSDVVIESEFSGMQSQSPQQREVYDAITDAALTLIKKKGNVSANEVLKSSRPLQALVKEANGNTELSATQFVKQILDEAVSGGLLSKSEADRFIL